MRPSSTKIKLSNDSALNLEGIGAKPVLVRHNIDDHGRDQAHDPNDVIEQFARSNQPLMYVHPSINFYDVGAIKERFTRGK
jgi:hypothetical protein